MTSLLFPEESARIDQEFHMPEATESEYALLGAVLIENPLLDSLLFLGPDHFLAPEHQQFYAKMIDMRAEGERITPLTLAQHFPKFEKVAVYLSKASSYAMMMVTDIYAVAQLIVDTAARRDIVNLCRQRIEKISSTGMNASEHLADLQLEIERIAASDSHTKFQTKRQVGESILKRLDKPQKGFSTGVRELDDAMAGGMYPGFCYAICGRKKMGKTTLAGGISHHLNDTGVKHLYIAGEMGTEQIEQRDLARRTESYASSFLTAYGRTDAFKAKISDTITTQADNTIYLNAPGLSFDQLRRAVAQAVSVHRIKLFILDSLQLVGGKTERTGKVEHQDTVAQWVADFGRQQNITSVVTVQMNQDGNVRFGEGIRLACDMAFEIKAPKDDPSRSGRWLEMIETRYTQWRNVGADETPALLINEHGPYFEVPEHEKQLEF